MPKRITKLKASQSATAKSDVSEKVIQEILNRPVSWAILLKHFAVKKPEIVQISSFSGTTEKSKRFIAIKGHSPHLPSIQRFKQQLSLIETCKDISLISLEQKNDPDGPDQFDFLFECPLL